MPRRRKQLDQGAFNKGTLVNLASIFGGLVVSGAIYVVGNWALYGDTLKRHDVGDIIDAVPTPMGSPWLGMAGIAII